MAHTQEDRWAMMLMGPALVLLTLPVLWQNETRFDYYRAAAATQAVDSLDDVAAGTLISLTGPMESGSAIPGEYVEAFPGFLTVNREAEIYSWYQPDFSRNTHYEMKWKSSVQNSADNAGVKQECKSKSFYRAEYQVGELPIQTSLIEFFDDYDTIAPKTLRLKPTGMQLHLKPGSEYFHLTKKASDGLGDERVRYTGIPVPRVATYFGKYESGHGVADQSHHQAGIVYQMIQDSGNLHCIVAGDRPAALAKIKSHLQQLKWIIRGLGTASIITGFVILFSSITGFMYHLPLIGPLAGWGSFLAAVIIGLTVAIVNIAAAYLVAHPLLLAIIATGIVATIYLMRKRGKASQQTLRRDLIQRYGHSLGTDELKELEFLELAQMAMSDAQLDDNETKILQKWAKKHRWDQAKYDAMIARARSDRASSDSVPADAEHLRNVVRLAMADGTLTGYEIRTIRAVSKRLGFDDTTIREMIDRVRRDIARNRAEAQSHPAQ
ncbi:TMEM43 family protein [Rosistilla oblonga]|uniref:TMEM43 family protein n=1 Tax=Rosistilla oblonga TaxID=2527990 RepID=UPI003A978E81